jgi:bacterial leucyl aminopeptidase
MHRPFLSTLCILLAIGQFPLSAKPTLSQSQTVISVGSETMEILKQNLGKQIKALDSNYGITLLSVEKGDLDQISHIMHENFRRCGGFMLHEDWDEAYKTMMGVRKRAWVNRHQFTDYSIDQDEKLVPMVADISAERIKATIAKLSAYKNRYYRSESGVESMHWIKARWEQIAGSRDDINVELYEHEGFPQPSVILTFTGSEFPEEIVVLGGHGDSIAGYFAAKRKRAPGADDNASGIATLTEIIEVAVQHNYRPARTVQFMAYAAEEVGLVGSKRIARSYKQAEKHIVGVLQLDMTNFKGSDEDIFIYEDFTNAAQNTFLTQLIDHYVKVSWSTSRCGYGCSDHASWSRNGYPASFPHEASMRQSNKDIHTKRDTLAKSGDNADHAAKFAKLGLAYFVEMAK